MFDTLSPTLIAVAVDLDKLESKPCNSPFDGHRLLGEVRMTLVDGRVVYRA